jgi:hypothetical protein
MAAYWHCSVRWACSHGVCWRLYGRRLARCGSGLVLRFGLCGRYGLCAPGGFLLVGNCSGMPAQPLPVSCLTSDPVAGAGTVRACLQPTWSGWNGCWTHSERCCCVCTRETSGRSGCGWSPGAIRGAGTTCAVHSRTMLADGSADHHLRSSGAMGYIFPAPPPAA